ncbi:MAG TPA: hypothetical protein VMW74_06820 [Nitrosopumilaceae archaeon]|nr:hypothetical protein [Nitrosopumilaceae archaeon]
MSDFYFLESLAIQIQENRKKFEGYELRLSDINLRLHEIPIHRSTESSFAKMIGTSYEDKFSELEKAKIELEDQRQKIEELVDEQLEKFLSEITSKEFVIPLDPKATLRDGKTIYKYRNNEKFENVFIILSEMLGLSTPLVIKDVMLSPTEIVIAEKDEFDAKQKFISIFSEVQNTLLIKKRI